MPITHTDNIPVAVLPRPNERTPIIEPGFGTRLTRICGDPGEPIPGLEPAIFYPDSRHHYSKDGPWNSDGTLIKLEQKRGSPSKMILNARPGPDQWKAVRGQTGNFRACTEVRWHPKMPLVMVGYNNNTRQIVIFDAISDALLLPISVPFVWQSSNGGFMGEGSLSNDGSIVAFGDEANNVCLIDLVDGRVGPMQKVAFVRVPTTGLDNITVSPLSTPQGGHVVTHGDDFVRVYTYGPDLKLVPKFESALKLSHADVGLTPNGREVFVGGARQWYGASGAFSKNEGNVAAIHLDNGQIVNISAGSKYIGTKEAADQHCSCRGVNGWVLETVAGPHEVGTGVRFAMELIAWRLDGSRQCIRFGPTRTNEKVGSEPYRNEAHGVMRPGTTPTAVMFASNSQHATSPLGNPSDVKAFVLELDGTVDPPPTPQARFTVDETRRAYPTGAIMDRVTNAPVMLSEVAKLLNKAYPS